MSDLTSRQYLAYLANKQYACPSPRTAQQVAIFAEALGKLSQDSLEPFAGALQNEANLVGAAARIIASHGMLAMKKVEAAVEAQKKDADGTQRVSGEDGNNGDLPG